MRVTKRTSIAIRLLMYCATNPDRLVTKSEVAGVCDLSENHLAQVVNQLGRLGYLDTQRGRNGGVRLGRPPREIGIGQVFRAIEGCVPSDACMADADCTCVFLGACALRHILSDATDAFYGHLDQFTLADVLSESAQLTGLLHRVRIPA
ncbi:MAG: Rrf2 family transcriptional regulator [Pseudooceanicola sp.]|nr:Rrf2 family transcriptional regulator [Pseudooceanicola sp.]